MNISYRWLRALAPGLDETPGQVADRLALCGAPVDEMIALGAEIEDIVIGRVVEVARHPNADRLHLCEVDAGGDELRQVVCGAPNVRPGTFYPFAPVGARLPGGIRIRRSKIRGVESQGMLCSERELGLGRAHEGIMELQGDFTPGEPFVPALGLDDVRIVVDATPNRPDLLSHLGVARELAPAGVDGLVLAPFEAESGEARIGLRRVDRESTAGGVRVVLEDSRGCPRYLGAVIRGVRVEPSPEWLASRLRAVGLRPINNVVDATNYILFELGQPLHAFDLDLLAGAEVRIRKAAAGEKITTLDGVDRILTEEMTVIADAERPVAVAGVMGGSESEVSDETRNIFLECALFDPGVTRKTRTALGLSTDASYRFERGVDPEGMALALQRAIDLIVAVAGGEAELEGVDLYPAPLPAPEVAIRPERATRLLGIEFDAPQITALLEPLGFQRVDRSAAEEGGALSFRVPGYRWSDVTREADLIEEVARRYGYEKFPTVLGAFRPGTVPDDPMSALEDRLRTLMVGMGFHEARLAAFVPEADGDIGPLNPLSSAESRLRRDLGPGLLRRVEANFAHGIRSVRLFEIGTTFAPAATGPDSAPSAPREENRLAFVMTGPAQPPHWSAKTEPFDLWDLKGFLESVARALGGELVVEPGAVEGSHFRGGHSFRVLNAGGDLRGWGGEVRAQAIDAPAWADTVYLAELRLTSESLRVEAPRFRPIPSHPAIERDLALIVPDELPAARVSAIIREAGGALLEELSIFDLFQGAGVPAGSRSIAYRLRFRARDRTLTDREVERVVTRILDRLKEESGVVRRG